MDQLKDAANLALGLDFGTESVRALIVDCTKGVEVAEAIVPYPHGVITEALPGHNEKLPSDFALQHADDYLTSVCQAIKEVLKTVPAEKINGIGVDFTACTILPIKKDGTPLMLDELFKNNPHSWVKLWKHHGAQHEADEVIALAQKRNEPFLKYYSDTLSCEWMLPKCLEIARNAPDVFYASDFIIDAGDWIVQQMTGEFTRNSCAAGYKGLWNDEMGFPSQEFLVALDPILSSLRLKWIKNIVSPGTQAGVVTEKFAELSGLKKGTPVSAATIDAHSGVAGMGVYNEGSLSIIMGTSSCHMALSRTLKIFKGYAGVVRDGIIPGFYGYESGQAAVGDLFGWYAKSFMKVPFDELAERSATLLPGESGLVALDWMNGSRTPIMNGHLTGLILGLTLESKPHEVYRSLIEATAFGTRAIAETHSKSGVPIHDLVVCGGLVKHDSILQIYSDVTGLPVRVAASNQTVALGAAIFGALAAGPDRGGFKSLEEAISKMTKPHIKVFHPNKSHHAIYNDLYEVYCKMTQKFGRDEDDLMKNLKEMKNKKRINTLKEREL